MVTQTTTTILPVEYKGYTIQEDPDYDYSGHARLVIFPTHQGIQTDFDNDRFCGNCKWSGSIEEAKDFINDLGYASHTARVKRFKKFYYEYQAWGGTFDWKTFRNDNRFSH
jgi:hypothetical protein